MTPAERLAAAYPHCAPELVLVETIDEHGARAADLMWKLDRGPDRNRQATFRCIDEEGALRFPPLVAVRFLSWNKESVR